MPSTRYGVISATGPLSVTLDGETSPVAATPINLGPTLAVGDRVACEFRDKSLVIVGSPSNAARDLILGNFRSLLSGGGVRTATTSGCSWSQRFIGLGAGRGPLIPNGYWNVEMPPDGTVIPVYGHTSQTQATVSGGVVPLINWQALWYEPPVGRIEVSDPARFRITSYIANFEVPPTWVPIVAKNGDTGSYKWADGRETSPWTYPVLSNSWTNYSASFTSARYKRENGIVYTEGLVKGGAVSATIFQFPAGYRPDPNTGTRLFLGHSYTGVADIRMSAAGSLYVSTFMSGASNADVSLSGVIFAAEA